MELEAENVSRTARVSLAAFTEHQTPHEPPAEHHLLLIEKLEAVERGDINRLMVFMPPGSAKSKFCSTMFPAWYMGRNTNKNVITSSYSGDLAKLFGRKVRNIVGSPEYREVFDFGLAPDVKARGEWATEGGGEYFACGVDGAVTGRRGDVAIVDDPVKGHKEADSAHMRELTWNWFKADLVTRMRPGHAIIIIMTRWNEDDLAGRVLPDDWDGTSGPVTGYDGETWEVLCLCAQAERNDPLGRSEGEWLWPEYMGPVFEMQKRVQDMRSWSSLYQQHPAPDDGIYFKRDWFNFYDVAPKNLNFYGTSDYAVTEDGGDFTEHAMWGINPEQDIYLVGGWYGQTPADVWIDEQLTLIGRYKPIMWLGEAGQIRRATEPFLIKRMQERDIYCRVEYLASIGNKSARARAFQARASQGKVYLPNTEYGARCLDQLLRFEAGGKLDDFVDAAGLVGRGLDDLFGAMVPKPEKPKMDEWDKAFSEQDSYGESWKTA